MPLVYDAYRPPLIFRNPHINTAWASKFRRVRGLSFQRTRFELSDGDFVDLDWSCRGYARCALIIHGLGGDSSRVYVRGMSESLGRAGWDTVALNLRGCSGTPNRLSLTYHSGRTDDLNQVARFLESQGTYRTLALVGFSLGGNIALKYMGEQGQLSPFLGAVAVSAPLDLASSARKLESSRYYTRYLLKKLEPYLRRKKELFPQLVDLTGFESIRSFQEYDDRYTAPLNGFRDAADYWSQSSALPILPSIARRTLILNALDDPFLGPECYPETLAATHPWVHLEVPKFGGHVGFMQTGDRSWAEERAQKFLSDL